MVPELRTRHQQLYWKTLVYIRSHNHNLEAWKDNVVAPASEWPKLTVPLTCSDQFGL